MDSQKQTYLQLNDGNWLTARTFLTDFSTQLSELNTWNSAW